jgi:D-3-phosphoglycerate dehydrogenase
LTVPLVARVGVYPHRADSTVEWERLRLTEAGCRYLFREVDEALPDLGAVSEAFAVIGGDGKWESQHFEQLRHCKLFVSCSVGLDDVDVRSATRHGIMVCNMPDLCTSEVADHTLALMLACVRKIPALNGRIHDGIWDRDLLEPMPRLEGKTVGLVGYGRIGRAVADRARAFGMKVAAHDPLVDPTSTSHASVAFVELEALCSASDIVSCHVPLLPETYHLIDEQEFRSMKTSAYFVNTCRGGIVNEPALIAALTSGWIAGAGIDVLEIEPPSADHALMRLANVILTPHAAGFSNEVVDDIPRRAVAEVVAVLRGGTPSEGTWVNRAGLERGPSERLE